MAQRLKNLPAKQQTWVPSLGWEGTLENGIATHPSILAWRIPWTEELFRLYNPRGHEESATTKQVILSLFSS